MSEIDLLMETQYLLFNRCDVNQSKAEGIDSMNNMPHLYCCGNKPGGQITFIYILSFYIYSLDNVI